MTEPFDAIVLAGAVSRRLGGVDKAMVRIGDRPMLAHVLAACADADRRIVVGPQRPGISALWRTEDPPGGGPVAAIAAGVVVARAPIAVLLACDVPYTTTQTLRSLVAAMSGDGAILVDEDGRDQPLLGAYRVESLVRALGALGPPHMGTPLRELVARLSLSRLPDSTGAGRDCDTWEDVEVARHGG
jgi:molybdopterin-guanine dinucleotide biosynthesis protein A